MAPQPGDPAGPAGGADAAGGAEPGRTPGPPVAVQPSAIAARTSRSGGRTRASGPAVADQPRRSAVAAVGIGGVTGPAVTTVAVQQAAGPTVLPGTPVGAVADQRAPQQRLGGRVDRVEQGLLHVGGLGAGIRARAGVQGPHELVVIRRQLSAQRLIALGVRPEQRRDRHRHLVGAGRQDSHRGACRRRTGGADRRPDVRQIRGGRCHHLRRRNHKRHPAPPTSSARLHESQTCDTVGRAFDPITIWKQDVALSLKELPPTRSSARTCCAKVVGAETNRRAPLPAPPP